jgi:hypothetical protein
MRRFRSAHAELLSTVQQLRDAHAVLTSEVHRL